MEKIFCGDCDKNYKRNNDLNLKNSGDEWTFMKSGKILGNLSFMKDTLKILRNCSHFEE